MIEIYTKSDPKSCSQLSPLKISPGNEFLSRKIFISERINFRAEPFERKFGTNFRAF